MQPKPDAGQQRPAFVHADRLTCIVLVAIVAVTCGLMVAFFALAAHPLGDFLTNLLPQPTPTPTWAKPGTNVALRKAVEVSREVQGFPASAAVDGDPRSWWGSGSHAPQWIEIDLAAEYIVSQIHLLPSQSPVGTTTHRVLGKGTATGGRSVLIHTFDQPTSDATWLSYTLPQPMRGVQYIRIETISSPSWVSWREIEVISGE